MLQLQPTQESTINLLEVHHPPLPLIQVILPYSVQEIKKNKIQNSTKIIS
jgi:hypothetical protein